MSPPSDPNLNSDACDSFFAVGGNVTMIDVNPPAPPTLTTGSALFDWWSALDAWYQAQIQAAIYSIIRALSG